MAAQPTIDTQRLDAVLGAFEPGDGSALIEALHDVQSEFKYLPEEALDRLADRLGVSKSRVYGVASFYEGFHLEPRGEHICTVCMGTACHVRGAPRLLEHLEREIGIASGQTSEDLTFTLEEVACVGACALGPLVIIDGKYHGNTTTSHLTKVVGKLKKD